MLRGGAASRALFCALVWFASVVRLVVRFALVVCFGASLVLFLLFYVLFSCGSASGVSKRGVHRFHGAESLDWCADIWPSV